MRIFQQGQGFVVQVDHHGVPIVLSKEEVREAFALLCEAECRRKIEYEDGERPSHQRIVNWAKDDAGEAVEEYVAP